jgi:hypothetical protein
MKERLTRQLLDGDMEIYLMEKDNWSREDFDSINWLRHIFQTPTTVKTNDRGKGVTQPVEHWGETQTILWRAETLLHVW